MKNILKAITAMGVGVAAGIGICKFAGKLYAEQLEADAENVAAEEEVPEQESEATEEKATEQEAEPDEDEIDEKYKFVHGKEEINKLIEEVSAELQDDQAPEVVREIDADVFIIPNTTCPLNEYLGVSKNIVIKTLSLLQLNGVPMNGQEQMLEAWITANDQTGFKCDNLCDHVWKEGDGARHSLRYSRNIPAALFAGKKEGEVVPVILPVDKCADGVSSIEYVRFNLTLNQSAYRYSFCAPFENAFSKVTKGAYDVA